MVENPVERVTAVVTSCGRQDLLDVTLTSFFATNTYRDLDVLVVEDGDGRKNDSLREKFADRQVTWIATGKRVGQIDAIDLAYSQVTAPYIFHMEDDWEFTAGGFIEKSLGILKARDRCIHVLIRAPDDLNGHPLEPVTESEDQVTFRRMALNFRCPGPRFHGDTVWHGFSFNPGLRRLSDYRDLRSYAMHTKSRPGTASKAEELIGEIYYRKGFYSVVLTDNDHKGYVRHIGGERHVSESFLERVKRAAFERRDGT